MPDDFAQTLAEVADAKTHFAAFAPGTRRDDIDWIVEARQPATRARRIAQAVEWIADGKARHGKYPKR